MKEKTVTNWEVAVISVFAAALLLTGASYLNATRMADPPFALGEGINPDVARGPGEQIHVVWMLGNDISYRRYNGSSWENTENLPMGGAGVSPKSAPDIWADGDNVPHVVWGNDYGELLYAGKTGGGWSSPLKFTPNPDTSLYFYRDVHIAVASDGKRHVVFRRKTNANDRGEIFYVRYSGGSWGSASKISEGSTTAKRPHIVLDRNDALHVVWRQRSGPDQSYEVMYRKLVGGSWEPIIMATNTIPVAGEDPHVAVDPSNDPHISFPEAEQASYIRWLGDSFSDIVTVGTGMDPVIAVDDNGTRYIFWDDEYTVNSGSGWSSPEKYMAGSQVPDVVGGSDRAHVVCKHDSLVYYVEIVSDEPPPPSDSIRVADPNGGEVFLAGSETSIEWASTGAIDSVAISYSPDGGQNWESVAPSFPNIGTYTWTVPAAPTTQAKVRVSDARDGDPTDASNATFFITDDMTAPEVDTLSLTDPTNLYIAFSEELEAASAEDTGNYAIDNDVSVLQASLNQTGKLVHLVTSEHYTEILYTITLNGILDSAVPPNTIAQNTTAQYVLEPSGTGDGQEPPVLPKAYALYQNFPNPFNPSTRITFALPEKGAQSEGLRTRLLVYNLKGQLVQALFEGTLKPGYHTLVWDGTDRTGAPVSSGVYLYRLVAGDFEITKKMSLMK